MKISELKTDSFIKSLNLLDTDNHFVFENRSHDYADIELLSEEREISPRGASRYPIAEQIDEICEHYGKSAHMGKKYAHMPEIHMKEILDVELPGLPSESYYNYQEVKAFDESVSITNRENVLKCFLLVQRAAAYAKEKNNLEFYDAYNNYLKDLGWFFNAYAFNTFSSSKKEFSINEALFDIISCCFPNANIVASFKKTLEALAKLSSNKEALAAFIKTSTRLNCFQIGMTTQDKNVISVSSIVFRFINTEKKTKILFFNIPVENVEFQYGYCNAVISEADLQKTSDAAREKLGDMTRYISDIKLAD